MNRSQTDRHRHGHEPRSPSWPWRWFAANSLLAGLLALAWLLLRSGARPSRLAYPCQRAALATATLALGGPLVAWLAAVRRHLAAGMRSPTAVTVALAGLIAGLGAAGHMLPLDASQRPVRAPAADYRAQLYHVSGCPEEPVGDRFPGLDALVDLMGREGLKLYESATVTTTSGPDGIVATDDLVVLKINYQWSQRGGTNTDLLRGLIRLLVDHPDGFAGEIVVAENTQFAGADGFDRPDNNAQNHSLSPLDVVTHFRGLGHTVSIFDWTLIRSIPVMEYSDGNMADGYVVLPYDPQLNGKVSYPKFQTDDGSYISMRYGIWDTGASSYDREALVVVNLPVLKSHHASYGVTACVKNWMGYVTGQLDTNSHSAIRNGLMGATMGEALPPDLNILDAIWVNADPYTGPSTSYGGATRRDELVASNDPVAADIWATTEILIPAFLDNGFSPPWPYPSADPEDPSSAFRIYLDNSMDRILAAGFDSTNQLAQIDVFSLDLALVVFSDGFESGDTSQWSLTVE